MDKSKNGALSIEEAAARLKTTKFNVGYWIHTKKLAATKVNGRWLIAEKNLRPWLENPESLRAMALIEQDKAPVVLLKRPKHPAPLNPLPNNTPDVDFLLGELRRKVARLESDNRRYLDQNTRFRSVIREEIAMWQNVLNDGMTLTVTQAKHHVSVLLGATDYDGRDEGPLEYREPSLGGNLREEWEARCRGEPPREEPPKISLSRPQHFPASAARAIGKSKKARG